ncbi:porin family protein [Flavihumibacter fluvii]|uniref:porin family protein n=1 Tax=Flavihumibacter fluvii TaxID=2838157 RepID=UPI001BDEF08C|nr:porin family protein [Flavihumibacter fluvii]ULQ53163.1 PorT family protein [Flavihumibacter fluvii]
MKKILLLLASVVLYNAASAQVKVGVQGIANLSSADLDTEEMLNPTKNQKLFFSGGIVVEVPINTSFGIRSGVDFLSKGVGLNSSVGEVDGEISSLSFESDVKLNYLQLPVQVVYNIPVKSVQLNAGLGGYAAYGVSGKLQLETTTTFTDGGKGVEVEELDAFKKEEDGGAELQRFDFGVNASIGIKARSGLFANISYQLGLTNIAAEQDSKYKNRGLQLAIGFIF